MSTKRQSSWPLLAACCYVCVTMLQAPAIAFLLPIQTTNSPARTTTSSLVRRYVASMEDQDTKTTTTTAERRKSESTRLTKAKILLDQFTLDEDPETMSPTVRPISVNGQEKSSSSSSKKNGSTSTSSPDVVPDNVWSNGLLDGSDVVTRYAFRKGVKIAEPLVKYDPVAAEKLLFRQPTKWFVRNIQIAGPLGFWAVGVVSDYLSGQSKKRERAQQLQKAISGLGPAIIKAGQALASRPDLLPSEYLEELQKLQDDVPRFSNKLALATIEEELGVQFDDIFELVMDEPVAAASIGQVYKARLKANGDIVAIKIQRPKCEEIIALDLYIL